jgi:chemotaxis protein CheX
MPEPDARARDIVPLPPVLDIAAAHALKGLIGEALASSAGVTLEGARVESIGTPAVQVLLAAARTCAAQRRGFVLEQPSAAVCAAFDDLGLTSELAQWRDRRTR